MLKSYFKTIYDFWLINQKYHIPISEEDKNYIDTEIYKTFYENQRGKYKYQLITDEEYLGNIIYLDQFSRNISRIMDIKEETIYTNRQLSLKYCKYLLQKKTIKTSLDYIIIFMPFKHLNQYEYIFEYIYNNDLFYLFESKLIIDNKFNKFYIDTYNKYLTYINYSPIKSEYKKTIINSTVCEKYYKNIIWPTKYIDKTLELLQKTINKNIDINEFYILSLSGGIDSMVMAFILKTLNIKFICFHLIYNNRTECIDEYNIIRRYCNKLNITLYSYNIKYFQRKYILRDFYEKITNSIRLNCYFKLQTKYNAKGILLGHIQDDIIENIWTNFANGTNLDNLEGMNIKSIIQKCIIIRPFLYIEKKDIYYISNKYNISFLLNTTPSWSNRGKFRNILYPALKNHYNQSEKTTIKIAQDFANLFKIAKLLLYDPIIESYKTNKNFILPSEKILLVNMSGWKYIFNEISKFNIVYSNIKYNMINTLIFRIYHLINNNLHDIKYIININGLLFFNIIFSNNIIYLDELIISKSNN